MRKGAIKVPLPERTRPKLDSELKTAVEMSHYMRGLDWSGLSLVRAMFPAVDVERLIDHLVILRRLWL